MTDQKKNILYSYPMRGLGIIAIFLALGPAVQTIAGTYLFHHWIAGGNLLIEILDVFNNEARPRILPGYSYYMPSVFLSGILCSLPPSRGEGLSLSGAIVRTILVSLCVEIFYLIMSRPYMNQISSENILRSLAFGLIQWIAVGWICWIFATGFKLDKAVDG